MFMRINSAMVSASDALIEAYLRSGPPLTGGEIYTDDHAPVEWLIDKSIVDYASGP